MGRFAQLVIGPAGSGKVGLKMKLLQAQLPDAGSQPGHCCLQSTYCDNLRQHCEAIGRTVHVVNLGEPSSTPHCGAGPLCLQANTQPSTALPLVRLMTQGC